MAIPEADRARVYVRLEAYDTILVTPLYHEPSRPPIVEGPELTPNRLSERLQSVRWMRGRNWISSAQADLFRKLLSCGVNELRVEHAGTEADPFEAARTSFTALLGLLHRRDVELEVRNCATAELLSEALAEQERDVDSYVGLWSASRNRVEVTEGSRVKFSPPLASGLPRIDHGYGPSQVLVLNTHVTMLVPDTVTGTALLRAGNSRESA